MKKGAGYELWSLRPYERGDSFRHIDWKAQARTGNLYVREFALDAAYTLLLLCDVSPSMQQGGKFQLQRNIAVSMAYAAIQENNSCGLLLYADDVVDYLSPSADPHQVQRIEQKLSMLHDLDVRQSRLRPALKFMKRKLPFCFGVILSDFQHDMEEFQGITGATARWQLPAYELVAIHLVSGAEMNHQGFCGGQLCLQDVESSSHCCVDLSRWREYDLGQKQRRQQMMHALDYSGISSLLIEIGKADVQMEINNFFIRRGSSRC